LAARVAAEAVLRTLLAVSLVAPRATCAAPRAVARAEEAVRRAALFVLLADAERRRRRVAVLDVTARAGAETAPTAVRATSAATAAPVLTTEPTAPTTVPTPDATVSTTPEPFRLLALLFPIGVPPPVGRSDEPPRSEARLTPATRPHAQRG
jgi:hypothetical protein